MNQLAAVSRLVNRPVEAAAAGLRKCSTDANRIMTSILGTQRQARWQRVRNVGHMDPAKFAFMVASERDGRG